MEQEIWKDIEFFGGVYQASNFGRIRSVDIRVNCGYGKTRVRLGKEIIQFKQNCGYLQVGLFKEGKRRQYTSHRLIAQTFIENPLNYKTVNHKNGIKTDNRVENLEWMTQSENVKHFYKNNPRKKKVSGNPEPLISLLSKI